MKTIVIVLLILPSMAIAQGVQERRLALISKLQHQGVFHKLARPAKLCHLTVGPRFEALPFDDKAQFVNVVYAYCVTELPAEKIIVLKDYRTGKDIGTYADGFGLRLK